MANTKNKKDDPTGAFPPAGLLIGMGFGFLIGELVAGMFIGLGLGLLFMALFKLDQNNKK